MVELGVSTSFVFITIWHSGLTLQSAHAITGMVVNRVNNTDPVVQVR